MGLPEILFLTAFLFSLSLYLLPTIVASVRKKRNVTAVFLLNLLLGWTAIGWIVALVWAFTVDSADLPGAAQPGSIAPLAGMHCSACGSPLESTSRFCPRCGKALVAAVQAQS